MDSENNFKDYGKGERAHRLRWPGRGSTAKAQQHAREPITSQALHDITDGEKKFVGERAKGGPTSTAQSESAKSRVRLEGRSEVLAT